jgi:ubiquinone/menaquinone biosynthesis C-methylase UbiE
MRPHCISASGVPAAKTLAETRVQSAVLREYARLASSYEKRWSFYSEATARETIAHLAMRPADRLIDVGCGTGVLLDQLARSFPQAQLAGVDPVPEMLSIARRRLPPAVDLRQNWAEELPFESERFEVVTCCSVFHCIPEPMATLREIGRVLRPGGKLVLTDWCADSVGCRILGWYLRRMNRDVFMVYRARECVRLLQDAGYAHPVVNRYKLGWFWGMMTAVAIRPAA